MAKEQEKGLVTYKARDGQDIQLTMDVIKNYLVMGNKNLITAQEMMFFMGIAKARGLNPFTRDCYLIKYSANENAAIITSIDFYRSRARAQKDCNGWERGIITRDKTTGELRYSKGLVLDTEEVVGGWFKAQPAGWTVPFELEINLREFQKKTKEGNVTKFWQNPALMISKCVESQGLRILWPDEFRGTITSEEAGLQLDSIENITPPEQGIPAGQSAPASEPLDTSKFDRAIKKLKFDAKQKARLEKWLADTAVAASAKKGKIYTTDMIKMSCANRFEEFLARFKEWVEINYPAQTKAEAPPEPKNEPESEAAGETGATPDKSFSQEQMEAWHAIISAGAPLSALQEIGVSRAADVTPDNIEQVLALADKFAEAQAKAKK